MNRTNEVVEIKNDELVLSSEFDKEPVKFRQEKNYSNNNKNSYAQTTCTQFQLQNQMKKVSPLKLNTPVTMHNVNFFILFVCR